MEHILVSQIMNHLEMSSMYFVTQFGFQNKHSCESQLLITCNDFAKALNNRQQVDIGILDLSKAFDTVSHCKLAQK